jgi:hypothetical protein
MLVAFMLVAQCRLNIPMMRWAMPPGLAPMAPAELGVRPVVFIPRPRTVPPVPVLPANRSAAFLILLPKFMRNSFSLDPAETDIHQWAY